MNKNTATQAPYHAEQLNQKHFEALGRSIGRVIDGSAVQYVAPSIVFSGRGTLSAVSGILRRLTDSAAPGFDASALPGMWVVVGGETVMPGTQDLSDRTLLNSGNLNAGTPTNFNDATAPFLATDVNKWIVVYRGSNRGLYQITGFVDASNVTTSGSAFVTETDVAYSLIDPKDNYGIYEVFEAISATEVDITEARPFPAEIRHTEIPYSLAQPAKITIDPAVFSQFGVHYVTDAVVEVPFSASLLAGSSSPLYLCMEMLDARAGLDPRFFITTTPGGTRNTCVIASAKMDIFGQFSTWRSAGSLNSESIRRAVDKIATALPVGWIGSAPEIRIAHETYPPRVIVDMPNLMLGGRPPELAMSAGNSIIEYRDAPKSNLIDAPIHAPLLGQRIDRIVSVKRRMETLEIDTSEGLARRTSPLSEATIAYEVGTSQGNMKTGVRDYGSRLYPDDTLSAPLQSGVASASCVTRSNRLGSTMFAYADASVFASPGITLTSFFEGVIAGNIYTQAPKGTGAREMQCEVDGRGFFHLCWQETVGGVEELWYMRIDPYAVAPQNTGVLVKSDDLTDYRMTCTEDGRVFVMYRDSINQIGSIMFRAAKDGTLDSLYAPAVIGSIGVIDADYDVKADWGHERFLFTHIPGGGGQIDLYSIKSDTSIGHSITLPTVSDGGMETTGSSFTSLRISRTRHGRMFLFCVAIVNTTAGTQREILAKRLDGKGSVWTRCMAHPESVAIVIDEVEATDDGKFMLIGIMSSKVFLMSVSGNLLSLSWRPDAFSLAGTGVVGSISHSPTSGLVTTLVIHDTGGGIDAEFGLVSIDSTGEMPASKEGVSSRKDVDEDVTVLAEIVVPAGFGVSRPLFGGYIAADATPLGPASTLDFTLPEGLALVDRSLGNAVAATIGRSIGVMNSSPSAYGLMILDNERSSGFGSALDVNTAIKAYSSSDNSNWTLRAVENIYREDGRTYILFDSALSGKYLKIHFDASVVVPHANAIHTDTTAWSPAEARVLSNPASTYGDHSPGDSGFPRVPMIHNRHSHANMDLTVGSGNGSTGRFSGWEGIQQALYAGMLPRDGMAAGAREAAPAREIIVGKGNYFVKSPLVVPGGSSIRLMPGAVLLDLYSPGNSRTLLSNGYEEAAVQMWEKTSTVYLSQGILHLGCAEGSLVEIDNGGVITSARVMSIDRTGRIVRINKTLSASGAMDVKIFALPISIKGWRCESAKLRSAAYSSGWNYDFDKVEKVELESFSVRDETPAGAEVLRLMRIINCRDVFLDNVNLVGLYVDEGLRIEDSQKVGGTNVRVRGGSGVGTVLKANTEFFGFSNIDTIGDGATAGSDMQVENSTDGSPYGRMRTTLGGTGLSLPGSSGIGFDEFINMHVHRKGNVSILNNGIYEQLIAILSAEIQIQHAGSALSLSIGVIDGLVSDAIIDAAFSS